jgi:hypothetical protein
MSAAVASEGSHADAVTLLGRNCHLPGALQSPMHALVCARPTQAGVSAYQAAVMDTILQVRPPALLYAFAARLTAAPQGGCNASRASFVGACFGAAHGVEGVPQAWRDKFLRFDETMERAQALVALRA